MEWWNDGRLHLHRLAGQAPRLTWTASPERVDPSLLQLVDRWPDTPAPVLGRAYDVLASSRLGEAAANTVAGFRLAQGARVDAPRIREVVQRLLRDSPEFARLREHHDARGKSSEVKRFVHPDVGPLTPRLQAFDVRSAPGQQLVVHHAEPGSPTAERLTLLGSPTARQGRARTRPPALGATHRPSRMGSVLPRVVEHR